MAIKLFKSYRLEVDLETGLAGGAGPLAQGKASSVTIKGPDAKGDNGFSCQFSVERSTLADANHAEFTLWGLGETVRKQLQKDYYNTNIDRSVRFTAGYLPPPSNVKLALFKSQRGAATQQAESDQLMTILFQGNVTRCYSERDGAPWVTTLEAQTGQYAYQHANTSRSFSSGTPVRQVITDLISDFPNLRAGAIGNFTGTLPRGQSYSGPSMQVLQDLVREQGGYTYVDNERVFCLLPGEYIPGTIPVISGETGLVGAPRRENTLVEVRTLFEPGLLAGQLVELRSKNSRELNGFYQLKGLAHRGTISGSISSSVETRATLTNYDPLLTEVPLL